MGSELSLNLVVIYVNSIQSKTLSLLRPNRTCSFIHTFNSTLTLRSPLFLFLSFLLRLFLFVSKHARVIIVIINFLESIFFSFKKNVLIIFLKAYFFFYVLSLMTTIVNLLPKFLCYSMNLTYLQCFCALEAIVA